MKKCTVKDCDSAHYAKGLCNKHYIRSKSGQSLVEKSIYDETPLERFSKKFTKHESGCWLWNFPRPDGRANTFYFEERPQIAYRVAYKLFNGEIPHGICVLHSCDNGLCVNPEHLFLGTHQDNTNDMLSKKRHWAKCGEEKKNSKLTEEMVREIRNSPLNGNQLSKKFGVNRRTVYDVLDGKTWKHVR